MGLFQLRDIGKEIHIKGVTNKNKMELIESILSKQNRDSRYKDYGTIGPITVNEPTTISMSPNKYLHDRLQVFKVTHDKLKYEEGFCIIDSPDDNLSKVCDIEGNATDIILPNYIVHKFGLRDGQYIEFAVAPYIDKRFVYDISPTKVSVGIANDAPDITVLKVDKVWSYIEQNAKGVNNIIILPIATQFEQNWLRSNNINSISCTIDELQDRRNVFDKLLINMLLVKCKKNAKHINVIVNLDKLYLALSSFYDNNKAFIKLINLVSSAVKFVNGGELSVIALTIDEQLASRIESYL
jgi:hypothetical protein